MELVSTYLQLFYPEKERKRVLLEKISEAIDENKISYDKLKKFVAITIEKTNDDYWDKFSQNIYEEFRVNNPHYNRPLGYFGRDYAGYINQDPGSNNINEQSSINLVERYGANLLHANLIERAPYAFAIPQESLEDE